MPRCQCKNAINNIQDNMSTPELSKPTIADPEYSSIAEVQEKKTLE